MSIKSYYRRLKPIYNIPWSRNGLLLDRKIERCPYCRSRGVVKRGRRQTKYESIQLYLCKYCRKTFNPRILKHKQYPLKVILDAISFSTKTGTFVRNVHDVWQQMFIESLCTFCTNVPVTNT